MGSFYRDRSSGNRDGYQGRGRSSFPSRGRSAFGRGLGGDRQMFDAVCSNCGKPCQVPFRPTNGKPVYCSDCFEKMGGRRADSGRVDRSDFRAPAPSFDQNKNQFDAINSKLDKILNLLEPKVVTPVVPTEASKDPETSSGLKETKVPKSKKVVKKSASKKRE